MTNIAARSRAQLLTQDLPAPVGRLLVVVPAHNEGGQIGQTIDALQNQTLAPDLIVVAADNCTDDTVEVAESFPGVRVVETVDNVHKKGGALNQVIELLDAQGELQTADALLVQDADSVLDADFLRTAVLRLAQGDVGGVGGTFFGQAGGGLVGMFQRNEYARYARDVGRLKGKVLVLTGTATVFRVGVLQHVASERGHSLPGEQGQVYDTHVLTEDNELTLALMHLGYEIISPLGCRLTTEVMGTWSDLAQQRLRWKRGALENLVDYGFTRITLSYWGRQLLSLLGVLVIFTYLTTIVYSLAVVGHITIQPIWMAVTAIFVVERVVTVRSRGLLQMAIASTIVIEMIYDLFLQAVQARAFFQAAIGAERKW
jgi:cellulose synthase/poly-beta-1,6-N-acetylglucosamine synthase-like glycosyltransferase